MSELTDLIMKNGTSVVLLAYFIYKDYKFNEQILNVLDKMQVVLTRLETWHEAEHSEV